MTALNSYDLTIKFKLIKTISEEKKSLFSVNWLNCQYFATAGGNCVSVYQVDDKNKDIKNLQSYIDSDLEEIYYCCTFTYSDKLEPLLIFAGFRGVIKCINSLTFELETILLGHGNAINDLKVNLEF